MASTFPLDIEQTALFLAMLRGARERAQADAEDFVTIAASLEHLAAALGAEKTTLEQAKETLLAFARRSPLAVSVPSLHPAEFTAIEHAYDLFRDARNHAVHGGSRARQAAAHAIGVALVFEDALMSKVVRVSDLMVRGVITASPSQSIALARRDMLVHQFSFLPTRTDQGWRFISDAALAKYLSVDEATRKKRLRQTVKEALSHLHPLTGGNLKVASSRAEALREVASGPALVFDGSEDPVGIITAFDLL
jgi:predicted transcriptional regulator